MINFKPSNVSTILTYYPHYNNINN